MLDVFLEQFELYAVLFVFSLGAIIGSFLNVVIYRFHTGKSLSGHSHCLSCGHGLRWFDLFPVFSYLFLRGRCRQCGCHFTVRYMLVEVVTGALFVAAVFSVTSVTELALLWLVMSILVVITVYDLRHYIIPDFLTGLLTASVLGLTLLSFLDFITIEPYLYDLLAAVLGSLFLFALWFVSRGAWIGFGDVKLAFPLGLLVGAEYVFSFIVWSFWIGAFISVALVLLAKLGRGQLRLPFLSSSLTIKSVVPFAPFLIAGCLVVYFLKINVLTLFSF